MTANRQCATGTIQPGDADASELVRRIDAEDPDEVMPPPATNKTLSDQQKQRLRQWIEQGAEYQPHWAFLPVPATVPVPTSMDEPPWGHNEIDAFVLARLQREGLEPAAPRRASSGSVASPST